MAVIRNCTMKSSERHCVAFAAPLDLQCKRALAEIHG